MALLVTVVLAALIPASGVARPIVGNVTTFAIGLLFFLHGAKLSTREVLVGLQNWQLHTVIFGTTFIVFPVVALSLRFLDGSLLDHPLYLGVLYLSAMPSTVQTSVAFTSIARGNVAAAICSATLSNLIGVILSPVLVWCLLGAEVRVGAESILLIACEILAPFLLGQLTRRWIRRWIAQHGSLVALVDRGSVLLVVYSAFSGGVTSGVWARLGVHSLAVLVVVDTGVLVIALTFTTAVGRLIRLRRADRIAYLFCGSKKSISTGLPMAVVLFPANTVSMIALPLLLYHLVQLLVCAVVARRIARYTPLEKGSPRALSA